MAIRPTDPEALHLYQLIGAPLLAVIQAEAQAAQVSADFISHIGFERAPVQVPVSGPESTTSTLQDGGKIGALRVAEFRVDRVGQDGKTIPFVARVPVLSLYPIPLMQVKHAEFDFDIRVVTRVPLENARTDAQQPTTERPTQPTGNVPVQAGQQNSQVQQSRTAPDYLAADRVELKGFLANTRGGPGGRSVTDASIKVRVRMEQSDLPAGLMKLLKMMDDSVTLVQQPKAKENEKPVP